ncbi:MAG TPA: TM0106 family RecB-like putative nuclease [Steroidobacteraceae bacterium]|nr:TM0106 family RecB-like putative nuclease [Steroidobacteraceae bacterium]
MLAAHQSLRLSASDLVGHLNCRHLTALELEATNGTIERPTFRDPLLEILWERGALHERQYVDYLAKEGYAVIHIEGVGITQEAVQQTQAAMKAGTEVIVQAALSGGRWGGRPDILRRAAAPSALGNWSYEVLDTKLARETRGGTVLQLCLYADLLATAQGLSPEYMYVVKPGATFELQRFRTASYEAYYRYVKRSLERSLEAGDATYPNPKEHCEICRWRMQCNLKQRHDDHLCLVAGITKIQIGELQRYGIHTAAALARMPVPLQWKPERGVPQSYERSREQARVQVAARTSGHPIYETIPPEPGIGLARLPEPSPGDIFFDLEGDPFVGEGGLEFLFGYLFLSENGEQSHVGEWAFNRNDEQRAFERFVDFTMARWSRHPAMHVYHYASYEPGALKRLMGRYATREDEVDRMLRGGLFVDLYTIVRQGIRASVESYSIKNLEVFCGFTRKVPLADVRPALATVQAALELADLAQVSEQDREIVEAYNRDDCASAQALRNWLEAVRAKLITERATIARPAAESSEPTQEIGERQQQIEALVARLTQGVPAEIEGRTAEQQGRWILAYTLDWHRRELKSVWWEYFRLSDLTVDDLLDERSALAGLEFIQEIGGTKKAPIHRYRFPAQDTDLRPGDTLCMVGGENLGRIEAVSYEDRTIDIKKRMDTASVHPQAVFEHDLVGTNEQADALMRLGMHVAEHRIEGDGPYQAARDLLLRRSPVVSPVRHAGETTLAAATRLAPMLSSGVLPIQGPPGAGKTYTAARMICELVRARKKVGITANSHKVIRNLLNEVVKAADDLNVDISCVQKPGEPEEDVHRIRFARKNEDVFAALAGNCDVAGGTSWLWARKEAFESVDVLFVDEAAQMSLANVLAVAHACKTLILVGDPQQLEQPTKGSHPEGTDVSALHHMLGGKPTIEAEQGLFLEETWRLHPAICKFTSELFYEDKLRPRPGLERQTIRSTRANGSGLRFFAVAHEGNQNSAPEEADQIRAIVDDILGTRSTWVDAKGKELPLEPTDLLIIAPYNAQVFELQERLPAFRVGTADKFQGQEAPIVIYSMTTSTHADAPRGMEFLYSLNRLNVATSRAKCLCILVGSPALFEPECKTPGQMELANAFCRYLEMATS